MFYFVCVYRVCRSLSRPLRARAVEPVCKKPIKALRASNQQSLSSSCRLRADMAQQSDRQNRSFNVARMFRGFVVTACLISLCVWSTNGDVVRRSGNEFGSEYHGRPSGELVGGDVMGTRDRCQDIVRHSISTVIDVGKSQMKKLKEIHIRHNLKVIGSEITIVRLKCLACHDINSYRSLLDVNVSVSLESICSSPIHYTLEGHKLNQVIN